MSSVLDHVEWGTAALQLLKHISELDPNTPAIMHIRHSERTPIESTLGLNMALTERGKQAAYEFGSKTQSSWNYKIYHTRIGRSINTAENIQKGIHDINGSSEILGTLASRFVEDPGAFKRIVLGELDGDEDEAVTKVLFKWVFGLIPPSVLKPSLRFAKEAASEMMENMSSAGIGDLVVWVSHDNYIAPMLVHWFAEHNYERISLLDGFILQYYEDHMMLYFHGQKKTAKYPYWWPTKT